MLPVGVPPLERALVRFIRALRYDDLPAEAIAAVSTLMRDQIALQIGGSQLPWSKQILDFARLRALPGSSVVAGSAVRMSAIDAAFVNAAYGHGFEYDDAHRESASHPGSCVVSAAMAIGQELDASMEQVIVALIAGYEAYTRIGNLAAPELLKMGFQPHCVLSVFGAAAVAAKLRGFDEEQTLHALAISLSHASGTLEYTSTGGSIKRIHAGIGTRGGMVSADMAAAGITGPLAFLTGNKGFYRTLTRLTLAGGAEAAFAPERQFEIEKSGSSPTAAAAASTPTSMRCARSPRGSVTSRRLPRVSSQAPTLSSARLTSMPMRRKTSCSSNTVRRCRWPWRCTGSATAMRRMPVISREVSIYRRRSKPRRRSHWS